MMHASTLQAHVSVVHVWYVFVFRHHAMACFSMTWRHSSPSANVEGGRVLANVCDYDCKPIVEVSEEPTIITARNCILVVKTNHGDWIDASNAPALTCCPAV